MLAVRFTFFVSCERAWAASIRRLCQSIVALVRHVRCRCCCCTALNSSSLTTRNWYLMTFLWFSFYLFDLCMGACAYRRTFSAFFFAQLEHCNREYKSEWYLYYIYDTDGNINTLKYQIYATAACKRRKKWKRNEKTREKIMIQWNH